MSHSDNESEKSFNSINNSSSTEVNPNALNWNHLENKLGAVAAAQMVCPPSPSASSMASASGPDSDVEAEKRKNARKTKEFQLHRKAHYNEMEALRRWREQNHDDDDDDDDEDEEMGE